MYSLLLNPSIRWYYRCRRYLPKKASSLDRHLSSDELSQSIDSNINKKKRTPRLLCWMYSTCTYVMQLWIFSKVNSFVHITLVEDILILYCIVCNAMSVLFSRWGRYQLHRIHLIRRACYSSQLRYIPNADLDNLTIMVFGSSTGTVSYN